MLQLQYQFSPEDALRYYETLLSSSHQTRLPRGIALLWGPALCAALMIGFQWTHSIGAWVIAVSFGAAVFPQFMQKCGETKTGFFPAELGGAAN